MKNGTIAQIAVMNPAPSVERTETANGAGPSRANQSTQRMAMGAADINDATTPQPTRLLGLALSAMLSLLSELIGLRTTDVVRYIHRHRMRLAGLVEPDATFGSRVERHELSCCGGLDEEDRRGTGFALLGRITCARHHSDTPQAALLCLGPFPNKLETHIAAGLREASDSRLPRCRSSRTPACIAE